MSDPNRREYETAVAQRPIISDEQLEAEFASIRKADERDGTNAILNAMFDHPEETRDRSKAT